MDTCITFDDIFNLYVEHFRGKLLYVLTDACYSGQWTRRLATKLEEREIGACGHLAKEADFLIKVIAACGPHQTAWDGLFSEMAIETDHSGDMVFNRDSMIKVNGMKQTTCSLDSTNIRCFVQAGAECKLQQIPRSVDWDWRDLADKRKKEKIACRVRLLRRVDSGRNYWQKVLVKDGVDEADCFEYVICDGYGRDPPEEIDKMIVDCFY